MPRSRSRGRSAQRGKRDRKALAAVSVRRDHDGSMKRPSRMLRHKRRRRMAIGEVEPSTWRGGETRAAAPASKVTFDRRELDRILSLYGRKVAAGEWRDYAIDFLKDCGGFSGFPRTTGIPTYRMRKKTRLG